MIQPKKTFDEFVNDYLGKTGSKASPTEPVFNTTYAYSEKIIALVVSDIEAKNEYSNEKWYQEYKPQIRRMLKAAVITTIWATGVTESGECTCHCHSGVSCSCCNCDSKEVCSLCLKPIRK